MLTAAKHAGLASTLTKEYQAKGEYHEQVYQRMRASYRDHYRRMVPLLVTMLDVRSNNTAHRPVAEALVLVKRYAGTPGVYYPVDETVPIAGVVRPMWRDLVLEKDKEGEQRINRINEEFVDIKPWRKSQPRVLTNTEKKPEEILSLIGLPVDVESFSEKAEPRSPLPLIPQRSPSPRKRAVPRRLLSSSLLAAVAVIGSLLLYNLLKPPPWISVDASFGNWPQATQSTNGCSYSNHFYHDWQTALNNARICLMPGKPFTDVDFEVQMQIQQGECGGIVFRADSTLAHYYDLVVCPVKTFP